MREGIHDVPLRTLKITKVQPVVHQRTRPTPNYRDFFFLAKSWNRPPRSKNKGYHRYSAPPCRVYIQCIISTISQINQATRNSSTTARTITRLTSCHKESSHSAPTPHPQPHPAQPKPSTNPQPSQAHTAHPTSPSHAPQSNETRPRPASSSRSHV